MSDTVNQTTEATRFNQFARFFKSYMGASIIVAALPIPTTLTKFIPTYGAQRRLLSAYASLFCFLLLALVFYFRHNLARFFFSISDLKPNRGRTVVIVLPALLIVLCVASALSYQRLLNYSIRQIRSIPIREAAAKAYLKQIEQLEKGDLAAATSQSTSEIVRSAEARFNEEIKNAGGYDNRNASEILAQTDIIDIPYGTILLTLYLLLFIFAEAAFVLMALREYLQDVLGLSETALVEIADSRLVTTLDVLVPKQCSSTNTESK
jgi:hypothetical protein